MINCLSGNMSRSVRGGLRVTVWRKFKRRNVGDFLLLLLLLVIKLAAVQLLSWPLWFWGKGARFFLLHFFFHSDVLGKSAWPLTFFLERAPHHHTLTSSRLNLPSRRPRKTELNRKCVFLESDLWKQKSCEIKRPCAAAAAVEVLHVIGRRSNSSLKAAPPLSSSSVFLCFLSRGVLIVFHSIKFLLLSRLLLSNRWALSSDWEFSRQCVRDLLSSTPFFFCFSFFFLLSLISLLPPPPPPQSCRDAWVLICTYLYLFVLIFTVTFLN